MLQVIIKPRLKLFQPSLYSCSLQCRHFPWAHKSFCSQRCHVETPKERRKWGKSKGAFPPLPLPLFSFAPSYFYSPQSQSSSLTKSKMAATNINKHKPLGTAHN